MKKKAGKISTHLVMRKRKHVGWYSLYLAHLVWPGVCELDRLGHYTHSVSRVEAFSFKRRSWEGKEASVSHTGKEVSKARLLFTSTSGINKPTLGVKNLSGRGMAWIIEGEARRTRILMTFIVE
jgi:hypothetical protein